MGGVVAWRPLDLSFTVEKNSQVHTSRVRRFSGVEGSQTEVGVRGVLVRGVLAAMPEVCVDCDNAKSEAEAKSAATAAGKDGLNLGDCQEVYKRWANCIEENNGQAKACKSVMDEFKACHRSQSVVSLDITPRAARHGQQRQR